MYNVNAIGTWQIHLEPVQVLLECCAQFGVASEWALSKGGEYRIDEGS